MQTLHHINQSKSKNYAWDKVCGFFFFSRLDFRFGPFGFFWFSIWFSIWFRIRLRKMWRLWYRWYFDSRPLDFPAYRPGDPGVFHSRCQSHLWTHVTLLGLPRTLNSRRSASPIKHDYLICVNGELNSIKTIKLMSCLCDFFLILKLKWIEYE